MILLMFWFLGFMFLVLFFTAVRIGLVNYMKNAGKLEIEFNYFLATHKVAKIKDGPLADLVLQLHEKFGSPVVNLYLFCKKENYVELPGMPQPPEGPFTLLVDHQMSKFSIFLPKDWKESLNEDGMKWLICHELGHTVNFYKERALECFCAIKRYYKQIFSKKSVGNLFDPREQKEKWADNFAAKVIGSNRSVEILKQINEHGCGCSDKINPEVAQHISNSEPKNPHNPLNLT